MSRIIAIAALLTLFGVATAFAGATTSTCGCPTPQISSQPLSDPYISP